MWKLLLPMLLIVVSNTFYNICAKSTPEGINTFASLSVTYGIAMVSAIALFFITGEQKNLVTELSKANWTTFVLGLAVVGLETGFLLAYRAGWKISSAQLVASIVVSVALIFVGFGFYHEAITARQLVGTAACALGLFLLAG